MSADKRRSTERRTGGTHVIRPATKAAKRQAAADRAVDRASGRKARAAKPTAAADVITTPAVDAAASTGE